MKSTRTCGGIGGRKKNLEDVEFLDKRRGVEPLCVVFKVHTAVSIKIVVLSNVTICSLEDEDTYSM